MRKKLPRSAFLSGSSFLGIDCEHVVPGKRQQGASIWTLGFGPSTVLETIDAPCLALACFA